MFSKHPRLATAYRAIVIVASVLVALVAAAIVSTFTIDYLFSSPLIRAIMSFGFLLNSALHCRTGKRQNGIPEY
jgi:hypothetical protein